VVAITLLQTPRFVDCWHLVRIPDSSPKPAKGWPHAIERALKAEALARELADMLRRVTPLELDLELVHEAYGLLKKAKEVLGDE